MNLTTVMQEILSNHDFNRDVKSQIISKKQNSGFETYLKEKTANLPEEVRQRIYHEIYGWGPLTPLIDRQDIFDIVINGPEDIFIETANGMEKWKDHFLSNQSFENFIELLMKQAGFVINQKDPFANGKVGPFRIHVTAPPVSATHCLTLRRHQSRSIPLQHLFEQGFVNEAQESWIRQQLQAKKNFLVVGPTGSGKTTFLTSLLFELDERERVLVLEDTEEIHLPSPLCCRLLTRENGPNTLSEVSMSDLVKQSLRMRPDRLVVGEIRGHEAKDLLQALATGHSGSIGTLHAHSAKQALLRLEMLIQMGAPHWSLHSIRQLIQLSLDFIIVLKENRQNKGVLQIAEIGSLESFGLLLQTVEL